MDTLNLYEMPGSLHGDCRVRSRISGDAFHGHPKYTPARIDVVYCQVEGPLSVR